MGLCGTRSPEESLVAPEFAHAVQLADAIAAQMEGQHLQPSAEDAPEHGMGLRWLCAPTSRASQEAVPPPSLETSQISQSDHEGTSAFDDDGVSSSLGTMTIEGGFKPPSGQDIPLMTFHRDFDGSLGAGDFVDDQDDHDTSDDGDAGLEWVHPLLVLQRRSEEALARLGQDPPSPSSCDYDHEESSSLKTAKDELLSAAAAAAEASDEEA
mmetsp:Transcript_58144/g.138374  ORF Transcript_58144/g.138374 Transcript_58144/m.138374 type:complete len:211 (-) Transcript_58144:111-743(-)